MKKILSLTSAVLFASVALAPAQTVVLQDNFEGYADWAAVLADARWQADSAATGYEVSTAQAVSGTQSIRMVPAVAGSVGLRAAFSGTVTATAVDPVVATFAMYDLNNPADPNRSGLSIGFWDGGAWGAGGVTNLIAIGTYSVTNQSTYHWRNAFGTGNWQDTLIPRQAGWNVFNVVFDGTDATLTIDHPDSTTSAPVSRAVTGAQADFNSIRLGEFAGVTGNEYFFDDISIVQGTEPSTNVDEWHLH